jgi:hypothetical protein
MMPSVANAISVRSFKDMSGDESYNIAAFRLVGGRAKGLPWQQYVILESNEVTFLHEMNFEMFYDSIELRSGMNFNNDDWELEEITGPDFIEEQV